MSDIPTQWRNPARFEGVLQSYTTTERDGLGATIAGHVIWNSTSGQPEFYDGTNWVSHFAVDNLAVAGEITVEGEIGTGTASAGVLNLNTTETTVVVGDQIGRIEFAAPSEASGTDAIAMAAYIAAEAGDTFSATVNDTDLVFALGVSEAATIKYRLSPVCFHPEANDGAALGLAATAWADAYFASGAVIGFNNAYTITHSAALLTFSHAVAVTGAITPTGGVVAAGGFSYAPRNCWVGQEAPSVSTDGVDSTPVITETYCSEVFVPANCSITGVSLFNGSNVTGNVTVALANSAGTTLVKSASTAGSGADAMQRVPFTASYAAVGPANYWIQVQYDSGTARYNTHALGNHGVVVQTSQTYGDPTSLTPATTFTANVSNIACLY